MFAVTVEAAAVIVAVGSSRGTRAAILLAAKAKTKVATFIANEQLKNKE